MKASTRSPAWRPERPGRQGSSPLGPKPKRLVAAFRCPDPPPSYFGGITGAQAAERLACPQPWLTEPEATHVFASLVGTALHPSNVSRAWRRVLERAEVAHRTPDGRARGMHELRRTFATRLRDRGVPLEDVQRLGRWASSKMLLEVYSASDDGRLRRAAEAVSAAMSE